MRREYSNYGEYDPFEKIVTAINKYCSGKQIIIARKFDNTDYQWVATCEYNVKTKGDLYLFKIDGTMVTKTSFNWKYNSNLNIVQNIWNTHYISCQMPYCTYSTNYGYCSDFFCYPIDDTISEKEITVIRGDNATPLKTYDSYRTSNNFSLIHNGIRYDIGVSNNIRECPYKIIVNNDKTINYYRTESNYRDHLQFFYADTTLEDPILYAYSMYYSRNSYYFYKMPLSKIGVDNFANYKLKSFNLTYGWIYYFPTFYKKNTFEENSKCLYKWLKKDNHLYLIRLNIGDKYSGGISEGNFILDNESGKFFWDVCGCITNGEIFYTWNYDEQKLIRVYLEEIN